MPLCYQILFSRSLYCKHLPEKEWRSQTDSHFTKGLEILWLHVFCYLRNHLFLFCYRKTTHTLIKVVNLTAKTRAGNIVSSMQVTTDKQKTCRNSGLKENSLKGLSLMEQKPTFLPTKLNLVF